MTFETPNLKTVPVPSPRVENLPEQVKDTVTDSTEKELSEHESQLTGGNLDKIGVSRSEALKFAIQELDLTEPLNISEVTQKIKAFQEQEEIDADGKIGKQTYVALKAREALRAASDKIEDHGISQKTQEKIKFVLEHAKTGESYLGLIVLLRQFQEKNGEKEKYQDLFKNFDAHEKQQRADPNHPVRAQLHKKDKYGNSFFGDVTRALDKKISWEDAFKRNDGTIIVAAVIGFIFFGNEIPGINKIPGTGSWFGRIGWLIAGKILGGDDLIGYGIDKAIAKAEGTDTTGFGKGFENGQKAVTEAAKSLEEGLPDGSWTDAIAGFFSESYAALLGSISEKNAQLKNAKDPAEKAKHIPGKVFQVLGENVLGNEEFMKIPKDTLENIDSVATLVSYLPKDIGEKLQKSAASDKDIKNFLKLYVLPEIHSQEASFWDTWTGKVQELNNSAQAHLSGQYIADAKLNDIIVTEISTLTQTGIATSQIQAKKMQTAILQGKIADFELDLNGIPLEEQTALKIVLQKIQGIFENNAILTGHIASIMAIQLLEESGTQAENETTLTHKLKTLSQLGTTPRIKKDKGTDETSYDFKRVEQVFETKKLEILEAMKSKGMTHYDIGNGRQEIVAHLEQAKEETQILSDMKLAAKEAKIIINSNLPSVDDTPINMMGYLKTHNASFTKLNEILRKYGGTAHAKKVEEITKTALLKRSELQDNYIQRRANIVSDMEDLRNKIASTLSQNTSSHENIDNMRDMLDKALIEYNNILANIESNLPNSNDIRELWNYYLNGTSTLQTRNSIDYLDAAFIANPTPINFEGVEEAITSELIDIESAYSIDINEVNADVNNTQSIISFVNQVEEQRDILGEFVNPKIQEKKVQELKRKVTTITGKYKEAIANSNSEQRVAKLYSQYQNYLYEKLGASLYVFGGLIENESTIPNTIEQKLVDMETQRVLKLLIDNEDEGITQILTDSEFEEFFTKYTEQSVNTNIKKIWDSFKIPGKTESLETVVTTIKMIGNSEKIFGKEVSNYAKEVYSQIQSSIEKKVKGTPKYWSDKLSKIIN